MGNLENICYTRMTRLTKDLEDIIQVYMQHNIIYYSAVRIRTIPLVFFQKLTLIWSTTEQNVVRAIKNGIYTYV
jgi:hypothetical protein